MQVITQTLTLREAAKLLEDKGIRHPQGSRTFSGGPVTYEHIRRAVMRHPEMGRKLNGNPNAPFLIDPDELVAFYHTKDAFPPSVNRKTGKCKYASLGGCRGRRVNGVCQTHKSLNGEKHANAVDTHNTQ